MTSITITATVCDTSHPIDTPAEATRTVTVDDRTWEIDLCDWCSHLFDQNMTDILKGARSIAPARRAARKYPKRSTAQRARLAEVRAWWSRHDEVTDRPYQAKGRIPGEVHTAYQAAAKGK